MPMVVPLPMPTMMTTVTTTTIVMTVIDCNNDNDHDRRQTTERAVSSGPPKCPDAIKSYFYVYSCSVGEYADFLDEQARTLFEQHPDLIAKNWVLIRPCRKRLIGLSEDSPPEFRKRSFVCSNAPICASWAWRCWSPGIFISLFSRRSTKGTRTHEPIGQVLSCEAP